MIKILLEGLALGAAFVCLVLGAVALIAVINLCVWIWEHLRWMGRKRRTERVMITVQPRVHRNAHRRTPKSR